MSRRQHGTGTVYQEREGRWVGQASIGRSERGTRRRVKVTGRNEREAKARLRARIRELAEDGPPPDQSQRVTVATWLDQWLPEHQRAVRPTTYTTDAGAARKWLVPTIGRRPLRDLTPADVRAVRDAVVGAGRSTTTARHAHSVLMNALRAAQREGRDVPPGVLLTRPPALAVSDRDAIPLDDARALLATARDDVDSGARWLLALLQGMRQAEVLGLTWDAIDLDRRTVDVSWQLQSLPWADATRGHHRVPDGYSARHLSGAYHLTAPKTASGRRVIPLVPAVADALAAWRDVAPSNPWGLVWATRDTRNGRDVPKPRRNRVDRAAWVDLQDRARVAAVDGVVGRRYDLHEARHTTATMLLELGVDPHVIVRIMGHSSMVVTRTYQHVSLDLARDALAGMADRLGLGLTPP